VAIEVHTPGSACVRAQELSGCTGLAGAVASRIGSGRPCGLQMPFGTRFVVPFSSCQLYPPMTGRYIPPVCFFCGPVGAHDSCSVTWAAHHWYPLFVTSICQNVLRSVPKMSGHHSSVSSCSSCCVTATYGSDWLFNARCSVFLTIHSRA